MRKAVGAARREFFTSSGHYAKDVAKSAAEKVVNEKLAQLHLQKQEQTLREKLGVKNGAGNRSRAQHRYSGCHEPHRRSR